jgi:anaerobic selenocysteine-containing dehydrogenase
LPDYKELPEKPSKEYPYILISGGRTIAFHHSCHRQIPWLREICPDPIVEIHPETAAKHGIKEGDWVWIETPRKRDKRVKLRAKLTLGIHPRVVHAQSHWWLPEKSDPIGTCLELNINVLHSRDGPYDPVTGATLIRGGVCKIYRAG